MVSEYVVIFFNFDVASVPFGAPVLICPIVPAQNWAATEWTTTRSSTVQFFAAVSLLLAYKADAINTHALFPEHIALLTIPFVSLLLGWYNLRRGYCIA